MKNILRILLILSQPCFAQHFSESLNPTGNPIGGGNGYNHIISKEKAAYVVNDLQTLKAALSKAKQGDVIYVEDNVEINLSSEKNIAIPAGVTLAGGRGGNTEGALLYSNSFYPENDFTATFITGGEHVRITGLRLRGPNHDILDHDRSAGYANAIRCLHKNLEVDNCELWAWDKWAIWLYISDGAYIHHNYIHHTQRAGYGYPVWCGGSGTENHANALIEANIFESARHCIASSGHLNSWEARYNVILKRQHYINTNRHGQGRACKGGFNTHLHHNLFFSTQSHFTGVLPADTAGMVEIDHNWFTRPEKDTLSFYAMPCRTPELKATHRQFSIHDNFFNSEGRTLPVAVITSSVDSGIAPLTVHFDSKNSFDKEGKSITNYQWRFGCGDFVGDEKRTATASYTFTEPGIYNVSLIVFNSFGIPGEQVNKTIAVKPSSGKYILSAWVKDTYNGKLKGKYEKQFLVDDKIVWREDVEGDEGWQHVIVNLDKENEMTSGSKHRLAARLAGVSGSSGMPEVVIYVDDIYLFNSDCYAGNFEMQKCFPPWNVSMTAKPFGSGLTTEESRSGEHSFRMRTGMKSVIPPNAFTEVYQVVTLK